MKYGLMKYRLPYNTINYLYKPIEPGIRYTGETTPKRALRAAPTRSQANNRVNHEGERVGDAMFDMGRCDVDTLQMMSCTKNPPRPLR